jgi:rare lipoprotein A
MKYLLLICLIFLASSVIARARTVTGIASFYHDRYEGRVMANGERFTQSKFTCATNDWPLGTKLLVTHGPSWVIVTVTDRGPAKSLGRKIDLTTTAFRRLGPLKSGLLTVQIKVVSKP